MVQDKTLGHQEKRKRMERTKIWINMIHFSSLEFSKLFDGWSKNYNNVRCGSNICRGSIWQLYYKQG